MRSRSLHHGSPSSGRANSSHSLAGRRAVPTLVRVRLGASTSADLEPIHPIDPPHPLFLEPWGRRVIAAGFELRCSVFLCRLLFFVVVALVVVGQRAFWEIQQCCCKRKSKKKKKSSRLQLNVLRQKEMIRLNLLVL